LHEPEHIILLALSLSEHVLLTFLSCFREGEVSKKALKKQQKEAEKAAKKAQYKKEAGKENQVGKGDV